MPESEHYFLHPVLTFLLRPQQRSRELIVGNGCPVPSGLRGRGPSRSENPADKHPFPTSDLSGQKPEGPVRRRLAAILAADVVGSPGSWSMTRRVRWRLSRAAHDYALAPLVARHEGRIVKLMGDGVLAEFGSAVNAVQCGLALRRSAWQRW
jgi:class 3 adenylate cyclase